MKIKSTLVVIFSRFFGESKFLLALLILFEISAILLSNTISFETSDERVMNLIASGGYTGEPSERLVFIHIFIGHLLKFLYTFFPYLNWYTWFLLMTLAISFFSFQFVINSRIKSVSIKFLVHLILLSVVFPLFVKICFTKIAALSVITGLVIIVFKPSSKISLFLGYSLVLLGVMIRMEVFLMLLLFIFPIYLIFLVRKKIKPLIHPTIVFVLGLILCVFHYYQYRSSNEWKFYSQVNYFRSRITTYDNPNFKFEDVKARLEKANWTKTDYDFVSKFYFDLGISKFSPNTLNQVINSSNDDRLDLTNSFKLLTKNIKKFSGFVTHNVFSIIVLFGIIILFLQQKWKTLLKIGLFATYCFLVINAFEIFFDGNYTKQRLLWVVMYSIFGIILYNSFQALMNEKVKTTFLSISLMSLIFMVIQNAPNNSRSRNNEYELQKYIEKNSNRLYVSWPSLEQLNVFEIPIYYKNAYFLGWLQGSPHNMLKLKSSFSKKLDGIYQVNQPYDWYFLCNRDDVMTEDNINLVRKFYLSNFKNIKLNFEKYDVPRLGSYWKMNCISQITHDPCNVSHE